MKIEIDLGDSGIDKIAEVENYLDSTGYKWKEIKANDVEVEALRKGHKITNILQHIIEYWYSEYEGDMNESENEHITQMISQGYNQGELNICPDGENEYSGWWKIAKRY